MTTNQILQLDYRKDENKRQIQKVLRLIKPLSKYSVEKDVPLWAIEKAITVMSKKYQMHIAHIYFDIYANDEATVLKATIYNDKKLRMIQLVYGLSIYELLAKCAICMYAEVKRGIDKR